MVHASQFTCQKVIVSGNIKVVKSELVHWMSLLRPLLFTITIGKMAMQSTIIAVYLHAIPHFDTNELWYAIIGPLLDDRLKKKS